MAHKTFISYKYSESRELRDRIIQAMGSDAAYYTGETSESPDMSDLKTATIRKKLADMIYSTSVTIVIISPHMKESNWIDWEIELINIFPILSTLPAFLLASFIDCDYGIWGVALISLLYLAKSIKISAVIMAVLLVPYYGQHIYSNVVSFEAIRNMCFSLLSILFVCLYNGQHGSKKKWIYYWAYPLHILFFAILRCYPFF